ncbi:MAG: sulfite exporter TauE/SafE family protein, partial [Bacteroidota bacterium]
VLTPLTLGTSLLCTFAASASGAVAQRKAGAIDGRTALVVGAFAAVAVVLTGRFVATQPWYDKEVFQIVLGVVLIAVVARMLLKKDRPDTLSTEGARRGIGRIAATGGAAGTIASLAGVGGGVVLVPALNGLVRLPLKVAAGTSTTAIAIITATGVATYAALGLGAPTPDGTLGYVDWRGGAALALPAIATARLGVWTAHRVDVRTVRLSFAAFAAVVAVRLLWNALA